MVRLRCHSRKMDSFGNDEIARLLRLKRYEQPPPAYFENFLSEFRRRQRNELLRQPVWRICFGRARCFALRHNVRPYPLGVAVVVACAAVISIRIFINRRSMFKSQSRARLFQAHHQQMPKENSTLRLRRCLALSTQSRFFCPEAGMFRCYRPTYSGPMNLPRSTSNRNHSTITHC